MTGPVERVTLTHLQVPFKEPYRTSGGEIPVKDAILVTVETSSAVGLGESAPVSASFVDPRDAPEACWRDLAGSVATGLLGRTFSTVDDIAALRASWSASPFASAGAESACWDLLGRARRATVADLLGAAPDQIARGVESGLVVGLYPTVVELLKTIETHLAEGYRRVKVEIRPGQDVELVRAVRQHFGDIELMIDANAAYTAADLDVFRALDDEDLLMFEQPMADDDLDGLAALQAAVATPVCIDQTAATPARVAEAIDRGACRVVNLKVQRVGGLGPALAVHDLCRERGVACWVGTTPELGVGRAQGIHLATLANCKYPTDIGPSARWFVDDYVVPRIELAAPGLLSVPARPGLGIEIDYSKVRHYQVRREEFRTRTVG